MGAYNRLFYATMQLVTCLWWKDFCIRSKCILAVILPNRYIVIWVVRTCDIAVYTITQTVGNNIGLNQVETLAIRVNTNVHSWGNWNWKLHCISTSYCTLSCTITKSYLQPFHTEVFWDTSRCPACGQWCLVSPVCCLWGRGGQPCSVLGATGRPALWLSSHTFGSGRKGWWMCVHVCEWYNVCMCVFMCGVCVIIYDACSSKLSSPIRDWIYFETEDSPLEVGNTTSYVHLCRTHDYVWATSTSVYLHWLTQVDQPCRSFWNHALLEISVHLLAWAVVTVA